MNDILNQASDELRAFLFKSLPGIMPDWWEKCVLRNLTEGQARIVRERNVTGLDGLDFAALIVGVLSGRYRNDFAKRVDAISALVNNPWRVRAAVERAGELQDFERTSIEFMRHRLPTAKLRARSSACPRGARRGAPDEPLGRSIMISLTESFVRIDDLSRMVQRPLVVLWSSV